MKVGAVVTTFNEERTIGALIGELRANGFMPVIVVDDQSTDATAQIATKGDRTLVINTRERMGIGRCLLLGWSLALDVDCDYLVQIDAGGSHDPSDAHGLLDAAREKGADVAIGSRFCKGAHYTGNPKRALLSRLAAFMCNLAQHGAHYSDWTSGYRVFSRHALQTLVGKRYQGRMHIWQAEVLARAGEAGLTIVEAPIHYTAGRSSFNGKVAWEAFMIWTHILHHVSAVRQEGTACRSR